MNIVARPALLIIAAIPFTSIVCSGCTKVKEYNYGSGQLMRVDTHVGDQVVESKWYDKNGSEIFHTKFVDESGYEYYLDEETRMRKFVTYEAGKQHGPTIEWENGVPIEVQMWNKGKMSQSFKVKVEPE
jgi:hypothetical protein